MNTERKTPKTREEVEALKKNWEADPCGDIEETEGFEEHRAELEAFSEEREKEWILQRAKTDAQHNEQQLAEAARLNISVDMLNAIKRCEGNLFSASISLRHYLKTAYRAGGLIWDEDNDSEIEGVFGEIGQAIKQIALIAGKQQTPPATPPKPEINFKAAPALGLR